MNNTRVLDFAARLRQGLIPTATSVPSPSIRRDQITMQQVPQNQPAPPQYSYQQAPLAPVPQNQQPYAPPPGNTGGYSPPPGYGYATPPTAAPVQSPPPGNTGSYTPSGYGYPTSPSYDPSVQEAPPQNQPPQFGPPQEAPPQNQPPQNNNSDPCCTKICWPMCAPPLGKVSKPSQVCNRFSYETSNADFEAQAQLANGPCSIILVNCAIDANAAAGNYYLLLFNQTAPVVNGSRAHLSFGPVVQGGTLFFEPVQHAAPDGEEIPGFPMDNGCVVALSTTPRVLTLPVGNRAAFTARVQLL